MRAYSAFSRAEGESEGAVLVFANTAKEARRLSFGYCWNVDNWFDQAVRWLRQFGIEKLANQEKLEAGIPHVVDNPISCKNCELWGCGVRDNECLYCGGYPGDDLIELYEERNQ